MKLTMLDRSSYLKGLLLLVKTDNVVAEGEKKLMLRIGQALGFEKTFVEHAINELIENKFLTNDIPKFSHRSFAESFILDGLRVAFSDDDFSAEETQYLENIADQNGINHEWLMVLFSSYKKYSKELDANDSLFVTKYLHDELEEVMNV